jgi:hypothetical protein
MYKAVAIGVVLFQILYFYNGYSAHMTVYQILIALENGEPGIGGGGERLLLGLFGLVIIITAALYLILLFIQTGKSINSRLKNLRKFMKSSNSKTTQTKDEPNWTSPYFKKD